MISRAELLYGLKCLPTAHRLQPLRRNSTSTGDVRPEPRKVPTQVIVIDRAEKPTGNQPPFAQPAFAPFRPHPASIS
ncbi:hypothetical protein SBA3_2230015 [Candidatus Sulfopaludibacter sp. SbA3]|nr:hypothetical protein SBA3_2230015 [Candidatus Sulfopaludibacter sp. SbA3]